MRLRVAMMASVAGLGMVVAGATAQGPVVKTDKGKVEGVLTDDGKVRSFRGIPYAAAPVGDLRWKAPQAAAKWTGVLAAKDFGKHCMQAAAYSDMVFRDAGESEDCLNLNVWAPVGAKKMPVMVWIYGGGFSGGGTSEGRQDGQFLAKRGVIVVSMNYRLGVWGFMAHPELTAESPQHASGNYGLMDMAAAIRWVHENIAAFGGDAENVTIFGESAGSWAVSMQMATPLNKGLFQKAIGESGGAVYSSGGAAPTREKAEEKNVAYLEKAFGTSKIAELRGMSAEKLKAVTTAKETRGGFGPDVDGYFLPDTVANIYKEGKQAHVPLMAGWNADEGGRASKATVETFAAQGEKDFPGHGKEFAAVFPAGTDDEAKLSANALQGDRFIAYSTWRWLEAQVMTGGKPVYRFHFELGNPGDKYHPAAAGAFHSDEINYVFGTLDLRPEAKWRPEDRALSEQMGAYWTNFAKTGDPNGPGLPKWPVYGPTEWDVMHLDATSSASPDTLRARYEFLDGIWGK